MLPSVPRSVAVLPDRSEVLVIGTVPFGKSDHDGQMSTRTRWMMLRAPNLRKRTARCALLCGEICPSRRPTTPRPSPVDAESRAGGCLTKIAHSRSPQMQRRRDGPATNQQVSPLAGGRNPVCGSASPSRQAHTRAPTNYRWAFTAIVQLRAELAAAHRRHLTAGVTVAGLLSANLHTSGSLLGAGQD